MASSVGWERTRVFRLERKQTANKELARLFLEAVLCTSGRIARRESFLQDESEPWPLERIIDDRLDAATVARYIRDRESTPECCLESGMLAVVLQGLHPVLFVGNVNNCCRACI